MSKHPTPAHLRTIPKPYDAERPVTLEQYLNFSQASDLFARRPDLVGFWLIQSRAINAPGVDFDSEDSRDKRLASALTWRVFDDLLDEATDEANGGDKPKKGSTLHQAKGNTYALARLEAYRRTAMINGSTREQGQWLYAVQMGKVACSRLLKRKAPAVTLDDLEETPALESLNQSAADLVQDMSDRRLTYYRLQARLADPALDYLQSVEGLGTLLG